MVEEQEDVSSQETNDESELGETIDVTIAAFAKYGVTTESHVLQEILEGYFDGRD